MKNNTVDVSEIIAAGSKVAAASTRLANAQATLGQLIAQKVVETCRERGVERDEAVALIRAALTESGTEGAKRAASAINSARPLIPYAESRSDGNGRDWPTVKLANSVLRSAGLTAGEASGEDWIKAQDAAEESVAEEVALAFANAKGKGVPPQSLFDQAIVAKHKSSGGGGGNESTTITIPVVLEWAKQLTPEALETLLEGLNKVKDRMLFGVVS